MCVFGKRKSFRVRNEKNEEMKKTKNLSSLKFNLKHMADAGATNSDNHRMHIN